MPVERIPLTQPIETRDGTLTKDSRCVNGVFEIRDNKREFVKRPGLLAVGSTLPSGVAQGLTYFNGFLYAVSSSATTGKDKDFNSVEKYLEQLQSMQLKNPVLVGFGIKDRNTFESACKYANGAIIGTAFIKALEGTTNIDATVKQFISAVI
jgi:tryptophan synthase alpha chain